VVAGFAQQPAPQAKPPDKAAEAPAKAEEQAKPAEAAPAKEEEKAASPAPSSEQWFTGSFDFGYRWVGDVGGSQATYRSFVNLGDGPKLTGLDSTITDPKHRVFDRIDARANAWGGDPYNTAHVQVVKRGTARAREITDVTLRDVRAAGLHTELRRLSRYGRDGDFAGI